MTSKYDLAMRNFGYLTEQPRGVPGIDPPVRRDYATRLSYYSYKPLYRPSQLIGLPIDDYIAALQHEGVPIERSETSPLHLEPLFQVDDDGMRSYGRTGDFAVPIQRQRYRAGDLPNSERYAANALVLPAFTDPVRDVLDEYVAAFRKVAEHVEELTTAATS